MAIPRSIQDNEVNKFVESSDVAGKPVIAVANPDGSSIGSITAGGDGAIVDGASASIKASVLDYINSNPLAVRLTDTAGDYVGAGAGTQYTEDAAAAANPTGTVPILVRTDTPATQVTTDGDNVAQRGTNYGAAYVQLVTSTGSYIDSVGGGTQYTEGDTDASITGTAVMWEDAANTLVSVSATKPLPVSASIDTTGLATDAVDTSVASIDTKTPALGQALAAASTPVVLTAAQVTTLTPPPAITGFATETTLAAINTKLVTGTDIGDVTINNSTGASAVNIQDGGNTITVDGTVAVTNAGITTIAGAVAGTEMQVDVLTMPTVTVNSHAVTNAGTFAVQSEQSGTWSVTDYPQQYNGSTFESLTGDGTNGLKVRLQSSAITLPVSFTGSTDVATQTTLAAINTKLVTGTDIGDVTINNSTGAAAVNIQDGGNTITVDGTVAVTNSDITSIKTAVEVIDNAISGSEMQVDVVGSLPAGTNAIGKLSANSGVDIGDVTLTAGTAAIGTVLPPDIDVTTHTNYIKKYYTSTGAVTDGIVWSPAAGKRWHVVSMHINTSAAAVVTLEDDKAGGDDPVWKMDMAANSGETINFSEHYPLASGEDAADLLVTTSAGNIYITITGYEI